MDFVTLFGREFIELIQRFNIDDQLLRQLMIELYEVQELRIQFIIPLFSNFSLANDCL